MAASLSFRLTSLGSITMAVLVNRVGISSTTSVYLKKETVGVCQEKQLLAKLKKIIELSFFELANILCVKIDKIEHKMMSIYQNIPGNIKKASKFGLFSFIQQLTWLFFIMIIIIKMFIKKKS